MLHWRETEYFLYKIGNKAKMSALTAIMKYCPEDSTQSWTGLLAVNSVFVYRTSLLYHAFLRGSLLDMVFSICIAPQPQHIEYVILLSFCLQYSDGMSTVNHVSIPVYVMSHFSLTSSITSLMFFPNNLTTMCLCIGSLYLSYLWFIMLL